MIEITQIRVPCGAEPDIVLDSSIRKTLHLQEDVLFTWQIVRHSVDARKKPVLYDIYSVHVRFPMRQRRTGKKCAVLSGSPFSSDREDIAFERQLLKRQHSRNVRFCEDVPYRFPHPAADALPLAHRPVVIGFGPAGIFCALMLARAGYRPIVLERGQCMEERVAAAERFWQGGELDPESNIQFGEGGAGTFSDGKLTSNVRDSSGRIPEILRILIKAGAPEDIRYEQIPHIGTDRLRCVVRNLREEILSLGGEIRFNTKATGLVLCGGRITGVRFRRIHRSAGQESPPPEGAGESVCGKSPAQRAGTDGAAVIADREEVLPCEVVVLAPGHSARDTFRVLLAEGVRMSPKDFAVGFRVSHPQSLINEAQYGLSDPEQLRRLHLAPASYKLTARGPDGRGVYSFCMCPGGWVVNASSEKGRLAVNGMSDYARNAERANSAIVMTVSGRDWSSPEKETPAGTDRTADTRAEAVVPHCCGVPFAAETGTEKDPDRGSSVLAGMRFQEELEKRAFELAGGRIPVQRLSSFEERRIDEQVPPSGQLGILGSSAPGALHTLLPPALTEDFLFGMHEFGRKIGGFDGPDTWVIGLESRTSSPVRILRGDRGESDIQGLYPCGEGAGYAGGIMSAAADGIRIAEQIGSRYQPCGQG